MARPNLRIRVDSTPVNLSALSLRDRWIFAIRPRRWMTLLVSAGLGQSIGIAATGTVNPWGLVLGLVFVSVVAAAMVLLNDWRDQTVDALSRRLFPESSPPRTIPDGVLESRSVLWAGLGLMATALGIAVATQIGLGRPGLTLGAIGGLSLFWMYSFSPIQLNYRGGGEVLKMLGIGFGLPWWQAYCQSGLSMPRGVVLLPAYALLILACAMAEGLVDESGDRLGGKRTFAAIFGGIAVRQTIEGLVLGSMIVWVLLPRLAPQFASTLLVFPPVMVMLIDYREVRKASEAADIDSYHGLVAYQQRLRDCIWRGTATMSIALLVLGVLGGGLGHFCVG